MPEGRLTRGSCPACHRVVCYMPSSGGEAGVFEAMPGGAWRPEATYHGPMRRVGAGRGSYQIHACAGQRARTVQTEAAPLRLVAPPAQLTLEGER